MRPVRLTLILAACALALCGDTRAQPPLMPGADAIYPAYDWRQLDHEEYVLFRNGRQIGNLRIEDGQYFARLPGGGFEAEASSPPITPPAGIAAKRKCACSKGCACKAKSCGCNKDKRCNPDCKCGVKVIGEGSPCPCTGEAECRCPLDCACGPLCVKNFGVLRAEISPTERVTVNGREVTLAEAEEILKEPAGKPDDKSKPDSIPDDSAKLSLVIIGSEADCQKAVADLQAPEFSQLREHCVIQCYRPDDVMISPKYWGGPTDGNPRVFLETADGKGLWTEKTYEGHATIQRLQKADPLFKPDSVPGPNQPKPGPDGGSGGIHPGVIFGVFAGLGCVGVVVVGVVLAIVLVVVRATRAKRK